MRQSSSYSSTHETEDISNIIHDAYTNDIFYPPNSGTVADPSFSPPYAPQPATESPQNDERPLSPSRAHLLMLDVHAVPMNHNEYQHNTNPTLPLHSHYDEVPPPQSDTHAGTSTLPSNNYTPHGVPNLEVSIHSNPVSTADPRTPHDATRAYGTSRDTHYPSANDYNLPYVHTSNQSSVNYLLTMVRRSWFCNLQLLVLFS